MTRGLRPARAATPLRAAGRAARRCRRTAGSTTAMDTPPATANAAACPAALTPSTAVTDAATAATANSPGGDRESEELDDAQGSCDDHPDQPGTHLVTPPPGRCLGADSRSPYAKACPPS